MEYILDHLNNILNKAFDKCGYGKGFGNSKISDRLDLCQFQCNDAFLCAKKFHKSPLEIANDISLYLSKNKIFNTVTVSPPGFINLSLSDEYLYNHVKNIYNDKNCGVPCLCKGETIIIDYGGANIAKALHIGHLRSAIIGESLKRLARLAGANVISDAHLGDWGMQMGLVIAEYQERYPNWSCFHSQYNGDFASFPNVAVNELNEIYPYASKKSKENVEFKDKANTITAKLQQGDCGYVDIWKKIVDTSINDLKNNYQHLGVEFDYWYGESHSAKYIPPLIKTLEEQNLLFKSEGASVVNVSFKDDKEPIPVVMIKKSDGSYTYATTDLATIIQRKTDFRPNEIWYVVDQRQSLHFKQVFRCAKLAQISNNIDLHHIGFGTMNGHDGKPYKTRDGGVMKLNDLINLAINTTKNGATNILDEKTYEKIAIAGIKFGDLINHRTKDYIFDVDKFTSSNGKTGVYLLYTLTRINSILSKVNLKDIDFSFMNISSDCERNILLDIVFSSIYFVRSIKEKAPNYIAESAYNIAVDFSKFYHETSIIHEPDSSKKSFKICLCLITKKVLEKHLEILGIEPVEKM